MLIFLLPVTQKWYPEQRGLAAGVTLGVFAMGSAIASFTQNALLQSFSPSWTFVILGSVYFLISLPSAMVLRDPPPTTTLAAVLGDATEVKAKIGEEVDIPIADDEKPNPSLKLHDESKQTAKLTMVDEVLSREFIYIYIMVFFAVIPGLVMISRVADIVKQTFKNPNASTWVVGVNGLFNVLGRALFGIASDRLGRVPLMAFSSIMQMVCMIAMIVSFHQSLFVLFLISMWGLTACYGAALGLVPGLISDCFGSKNVGALYGVSLTGWAASGVLGGIGFTALIKAQRSAGMPENRVYDICLYSMIPVAALSMITLGLFVISKRRSTKSPA
jgi:MFS family permease